MSQFDQMSLGGLKAQDKVKKCPECGSSDVENQHGEIICKKCGLVIE